MSNFNNQIRANENLYRWEEICEYDQNHVSDSGRNRRLQGGTSVNYTGSFLQQLIQPDSFTGVYEN